MLRRDLRIKPVPFFVMKYFPAAAEFALERGLVPALPPSLGQYEELPPRHSPVSPIRAVDPSLAPHPMSANGNGTNGNAPHALEDRPVYQELRMVTARVLVVDDEAGVLEVVIRMLRGAGYQVCGASDGEAGWDLLTTHQFDLLVTDHDMPRLSGLALLRRLRGARLSLPAILISGRVPWEERDLASLLVPGRAIAKPFAMAVLLAAARELLVPTAPAAPEDESVSHRLKPLKSAPDPARRVD